MRLDVTVVFQSLNCYQLMTLDFLSQEWLDISNRESVSIHEYNNIFVVLR